MARPPRTVNAPQYEQQFADGLDLKVAQGTLVIDVLVVSPRPIAARLVNIGVGSTVSQMVLEPSFRCHLNILSPGAQSPCPPDSPFRGLRRGSG